jgi:head-tail adaptor
MLPAGQLDRRVDVLREIASGPDVLNAPVTTWQAVRSAWAQKVAKAESEQFDPKTNVRFVSRVVTFRMRWFADIAETDRLSSEGIEYDIKGIHELGRREGIEVTAEARA